MNLIRKHDEGCLEHNIDRELSECVCEKKEDNWNLFNEKFAIGEQDRLVVDIEDFKTFIQKVKEDDASSIDNVKGNKDHDLGFWRGYSLAMEDTNSHRNKRAGNL